MISLFFEPHQIRAMQGYYTKDGRFEIVTADIAESDLLKDIISGSEDTSELENFLFECRREFGAKEDFYIVLPNSIFITTDIIGWETESDIAQEIVSKTEKKISDIYYSCPIVCSPKGQQKKTTVCVIDKYIIDKIARAAVNANIRLVSVESAGISLIRTKENFHSEILIFECYRDFASITAYSGIAGAFSMDKPELTSAELTSDLTYGETALNIEIVNTDQIAEKEFENTYNIDVPYFVYTSFGKVKKISCLAERMAEVKNWPEIVVSSPVNSNIAEWLPNLGTFFQTAPVPDLVFRKKPVYMNFTGGNLLPAEAMQKTRALQIKDKTSSFIKYAIAGMFVVFMIEMGLFLYFNSVEIPESLKTDYEEAYRSSGDITTEMELIKRADNEDAACIRCFSEMMKTKPKEVNFVTVEINNSEQANSHWVNLSAVSADPIKFQDYLASLSMNSVFSNASVIKISSDTSGAKLAEIIANRGGGTQ